MESKEKEDKKKNRHVQFMINESVEVRREEVEGEAQDDGVKLKKRKKSKKTDNGPLEEQD